MAPWLIPLAASVLQGQQNREKENRTREEEQASIAAQRARALGFPSYGIQAADDNRELEEKYGRQNYLAALLPMAGKYLGGQ